MDRIGGKVSEICGAQSRLVANVSLLILVFGEKCQLIRFVEIELRLLSQVI